MRRGSDAAGARGFTLVEILIVLAIVGILLMIAAPRFLQAVERAKEGATKGNLGAIRSALSVYYADMGGAFPADPDALTTDAKYLAAIPPAKLPRYHADSAAFTEASAPGDGGGWRYDNVPGDGNFGGVWVGCTHTDARGTAWSTY